MDKVEQLIQQTIDEFINHQKFSDELFVRIFKKIMQEHPDENNRQTAIRAMVEIYEQKYLPEMRRHEKNMQKAKELANNEFGADKSQDFRHAFSIPDTLFLRLKEAVELVDKGGPAFMSEQAFKDLKEDVWFAKNFPEYVVPEKY